MTDTSSTTTPEEPDAPWLSPLIGGITNPAVSADAEQLLALADEAKSRELIAIEPGRRFALVLSPGQEVHELEVDPEEHQDHPDHKRGTVVLRNADSFVEYVERHRDPLATTLWSDIDQARVVAVLDDHARDTQTDSDGLTISDGTPGWGRHRALLQLKHTKDWQHWLRMDGKMLDQRAFAEHIEDGVDAIHEPTPADMLEVAQTFHAKSGANFLSSQALGGDVEFKFEETVKAKAGQTGHLEVPQTFKLAITPFEGADAAYPLVARFRYRLNDGVLSLGYRLIRPDRVLETAFGDIVRTISGGADLPVMAGTPRPS